MISSTVHSSVAYTTWYMETNGYVNSGYVRCSSYVYPTIYLKSNVSIINGDGSSTNTYKLSN